MTTVDRVQQLVDERRVARELLQAWLAQQTPEAQPFEEPSPERQALIELCVLFGVLR